LSYGVFGEYADIDLSTGNVSQYEIRREWFDSYLGGRGIGARLLLDELEEEASPLEPENILIFATGPFQGTGIAGASRYAILTVSPVTGSVSDSYVGGFFPHELGRSGFDGLIIRGQSENPVYVLVYEGEVKILNADDLWGRDVLSTDRTLRERHPGARVATIGRGGERLIPFATIMSDANRASGRPGFGTVMGSKQLKAIVVAGSVEKAVFNPSLFSELRRGYARWLMEDPATQKRQKLGTAKCILELNQLGILPTRNFQQGTFAGANDISGETLEKKILVRRDTCTGCPVACKRVVHTRFGNQEVIDEYGGMEYETIAALGSLCQIDDLAAIALASQKCNQYGLDTITVGISIAAAMEATERGYLKGEGIRFGDAHAMVKLIDHIARGEGLGVLLSQGARALEQEWGSEFVLHVKGQAVPMHDPRAKKGMGISYATSPRGATHMEGFDDEMFINAKDPTPELGVLGTVDWRGWERKPELCVTYENLMSFTNSLVMCSFVSMSKAVGAYYPYDRILKILEALTGEAIDSREMLDIGNRNYRLLEDLHVIDAHKDDLPPRFKTPLPAGPCAGQRITDEALQRAIAAYRATRRDQQHPISPNS